MKNSKLNLKYRRAFTLLEIMLVVAIIALLLGAAIVGIAHNAGIAKEVVARGEIQAYETGLQSYTILAPSFPSTAQGLQALVTLPTLPPVPKRWKPTMKAVKADPWGHPYIYLCPGKHNADAFDLSSAGADGKENTEDDITNWSQ